MSVVGWKLLGCWKNHDIFPMLFYAKILYDFSDNPIRMHTRVCVYMWVCAHACVILRKWEGECGPLWVQLKGWEWLREKRAAQQVDPRKQLFLFPFFSRTFQSYMANSSLPPMEMVSFQLSLYSYSSATCLDGRWELFLGETSTIFP